VRYVAEPLSERPQAAAVGAKSARTYGVGVALARVSTAWRQFLLLSTRYLELLWNDKKNLAILLLQAPVIAIMLAVFIAELDDGSMFRSPAPPPEQADAQKFLFIMAFSAVMFGCINAAREIVKEAAIYRRERTVSLRIAPYLFSKITVLGVLCLAQCLVLELIVMAAAPLHGGVALGAFWEVFIALSLAALCGMMLGLTISALVPNNDQAMSFIPLVLIPQVVFSGAIFPLRQIVLQVVGLAFVARWAMASLGSTMRLDGTLLGGDRLLGSCASCLTYRHGDVRYLLLTWGVPLAMVIVLTGLTAYLLRRKDVSR
jgi:hypothetical protein